MKIPSFSPKKYLDALLKRYPIRTFFLYSLLSELLIILFLFLSFLLAAEILLPGFISLRLNLTWFLVFLLFMSSLVFYIGKTSEIKPSQKMRFEKVLIVISCLFSVSILTLSLYRFPWWSILIVLGCISLTSFWAWQSFLRCEDTA
jgi:small-conductance mechanosensitive channel